MSEERVYRNIRFRQENAFAGLAVYAVIYIAPGIIIGRYFRDWAGLIWMAIGAAFFLLFAWKCLFPDRLVADRDGIRLEGRWRDTFALGYEKMHEALWREVSATAWRILGPVVFVEPAWPMQYKSDRRIVISHAGEPLVIREDEYGDLAELAEALRRHRVPGFADDRRPMQTYGGTPA